MRAAMLLAFVAACSGRCQSVDAVRDELGADAACGVSQNAAICVRGTRVFQCVVDGTFSHVATCTLIGRFEPLTPPTTKPESAK